MKKKLFLCNTVYQVIIATWMKYSMFEEDKVDIIISNHMNGYKDIANNVKKTDLFNNVYTVDSFDYSRGKHSYNSKNKARFYLLFKKKELNSFIKLKIKYDEFFVSNLDMFTELLYATLGKQGTQLHMFEDGISTYSKLYEQFYNRKKLPESKRYNIIYRLLRYKPIYGNVKSLWVLNPSSLLWNPDFEVKKIPALQIDNDYKKIVNTIFDYENMKDVYDRKYIYFEESFFAETGYTEDVELVNKLADIVGKENIMVKIHPRNPKNRFKELGYKTNEDTSMPWEVILMNNDFSDKILITIGSQTIVTPCILFDMHIKSFSLYNCVNEKPKDLSGSLFDVLLKLYDKYSEDITLCDSIDDIQ